MKKENGFTIIELMIAVAIAGIVLSATYVIYRSQQKTYVAQDQVTAMQQNLRGGMYCMQKDIRMAGYDPQDNDIFGITNIMLDANGDGTITFTADDNLNEAADATDGDGVLDGANLETFAYSLYDDPIPLGDGVLDLGRTNSGAQVLLAENVIALAFAYAYDDGSGLLATTANDNVIWAIDSPGDPDNDLDLNLDINDDGFIDQRDDTDNSGVIDSADGGAADINPDMNIMNIRAVRIWILARGDRAEEGFVDTQSYVVGNRIITPNDGFRHRLLKTTVQCPNLGI